MYDVLDDSEEAIAWREREEQNKQQETLDYHALINSVFSSEEGQKLLEIWLRELVMRPIVVSGQPLEAHGIREGKSEFVRNILHVLELNTLFISA